MATAKSPSPPTGQPHGYGAARERQEKAPRARHVVQPQALRLELRALVPTPTYRPSASPYWKVTLRVISALTRARLFRGFRSGDHYSKLHIRSPKF